jgi:hypothetical protein
MILKHAHTDTQGLRGLFVGQAQRNGRKWAGQRRVQIAGQYSTEINTDLTISRDLGVPGIIVTFPTSSGQEYSLIPFKAP